MLDLSKDSCLKQQAAVIDHATGEIIGTDRQVWAERIRARFQDSVTGIIDVGRLLIEAKAALPHGEFGAMCERDLPFGDRTARRYMAIASHPVISNRTHGSVLPTSWRTLYELSRIDPAKLETLITMGAITPELERKDINRLVGYHHVSDDSYEWYTPSKYLAAAHTVMGGIDLDPASCAQAQALVQAGTYYTKEANGLLRPWRGRVWLNPPYCMPEVAQFVEKALEHYSAGEVPEAIILTNNATDTDWFQNALRFGPVCFTDGRITFYGPDGDLSQTRQGQAFIYLGPHRARFAEVFAAFGTVLFWYGEYQ